MKKKFIRLITISITTLVITMGIGAGYYYYRFIIPQQVRTYLNSRSSDQERNAAMWAMCDEKLINRVPVWIFWKGLSDPYPVVRRHITSAIPRISCSDWMMRILLRKAIQDPDPYAKDRALESAVSLARRLPDLAPDMRKFLNHESGEVWVKSAFEFLQAANRVEPQDYEFAEKIINSDRLALAQVAQKFLLTSGEYTGKNQQALKQVDQRQSEQQMRFAQQRLESLRQETDLRQRIRFIDQYLERPMAYYRIPEDFANSWTKDLQVIRQETLAAIQAAKKAERESMPALSGNAVTPLELWRRITQKNLLFPFTVSELSQMAGIPVFVSGPHVKDFDRDYLQDFGHYNPAYVAWAKKKLVPRDWEYFEATRAIFRQYLQHPLQYMLTARYALLADPNLFNEYRSKYKAALASATPFVPYRALGGYQSELGADPTYLAYWIRRDLDGTAAAVQELLEMISDAYNPGISMALKQRYLKSPSPYALTHLGQYHGAEVNFENGESVFVLVKNEDGSAKLTSDTVEIERTYDAIADQEGQASGKSVTLKSGATKGLILRGPYTEGSVTGVSIPSLDECANDSCAVSFGKKKYTIRVMHVEEVNVESENVKLYSLEVSDGSNKRFLPGVRDIVWSGDLDRDGKLDLLYNDAAHYNVGVSLHLFLSGPAKDSVFTEVASFTSTGC